MTAPDKGNGKDPNLLGAIDPVHSVDSAAVVLTQSDASRLIFAIQELGKMNLRLVAKFESVSRLMIVGLMVVGCLVGGLGTAIWHLRHQYEDLKQNARRQAETAGELRALVAHVRHVKRDIATIPRLSTTAKGTDTKPVKLSIAPCTTSSGPRPDASIELMIDVPKQDASVE